MTVVETLLQEDKVGGIQVCLKVGVGAPMWGGGEEVLAPSSSIELWKHE